MLIKSSRNCHFTGADYRFILQNKLGDQYDEEKQIEQVPVLKPQNDEVVNITKRRKKKNSNSSCFHVFLEG